MIIAMPVTADEQVGGGWGRAHEVAVATVEESGTVSGWEVFPVQWDVWHDQGGEGQHHARIAQFLMDHQVQAVLTGHMGPGMAHMLDKMHIRVLQNVSGAARDAARQFVLTGSTQ